MGITNTDARIKLKYGQQFGIEIESQLGAYTLVRIVVPMNPPLSSHQPGVLVNQQEVLSHHV